MFASEPANQPREHRGSALPQPRRRAPSAGIEDSSPSSTRTPPPAPRLAEENPPEEGSPMRRYHLPASPAHVGEPPLGSHPARPASLGVASSRFAPPPRYSADSVRPFSSAFTEKRSTLGNSVGLDTSVDPQPMYAAPMPTGAAARLATPTDDTASISDPFADTMPMQLAAGPPYYSAAVFADSPASAPPTHYNSDINTAGGGHSTLPLQLVERIARGGGVRGEGNITTSSGMLTAVPESPNWRGKSPPRRGGGAGAATTPSSRTYRQSPPATNSGISHEHPQLSRLRFVSPDRSHQGRRIASESTHAPDGATDDARPTFPGWKAPPTTMRPTDPPPPSTPTKGSLFPKHEELMHRNNSRGRGQSFPSLQMVKPNPTSARRLVQDEDDKSSSTDDNYERVGAPQNRGGSSSSRVIRRGSCGSSDGFLRPATQSLGREPVTQNPIDVRFAMPHTVVDRPRSTEPFVDHGDQSSPVSSRAKISQAGGGRGPGGPGVAASTPVGPLVTRQLASKSPSPPTATVPFSAVDEAGLHPMGTTAALFGGFHQPVVSNPSNITHQEQVSSGEAPVRRTLSRNNRSNVTYRTVRPGEGLPRAQASAPPSSSSTGIRTNRVASRRSSNTELPSASAFGGRPSPLPRQSNGFNLVYGHQNSGNSRHQQPPSAITRSIPAASHRGDGISGNMPPLRSAKSSSEPLRSKSYSPTHRSTSRSINGEAATGDTLASSASSSISDECRPHVHTRWAPPTSVVDGSTPSVVVEVDVAGQANIAIGGGDSQRRNNTLHTHGSVNPNLQFGHVLSICESASDDDDIPTLTVLGSIASPQFAATASSHARAINAIPTTPPLSRSQSAHTSSSLRFNTGSPEKRVPATSGSVTSSGSSPSGHHHHVGYYLPKEEIASVPPYVPDALRDTFLRATQLRRGGDNAGSGGQRRGAGGPGGRGIGGITPKDDAYRWRHEPAAPAHPNDDILVHQNRSRSPIRPSPQVPQTSSLQRPPTSTTPERTRPLEVPHDEAPCLSDAVGIREMREATPSLPPSTRTNSNNRRSQPPQDQDEDNGKPVPVVIVKAPVVREVYPFLINGMSEKEYKKLLLTNMNALNDSRASKVEQGCCTTCF